MVRRSEIINALLEQFVSDGVVNRSNVTRRLVFLHECNDFPSIYAITPRESRVHYGANSRIAQLQVNIRGFSYSGDDAVGEAELLARRIEESIDTFARSNEHLNVYEARVISLRTDEGLFEPHGIVDITTQITYEV